MSLFAIPDNISVTQISLSGRLIVALINGVLLPILLVKVWRVVALLLLLSIHSILVLVRIVHVLLVLHLRCAHLRVSTLSVLNHELEHLELVFLESSHVLHLLLMNSLCLLKLAAMVALGFNLFHLYDVLSHFAIALRGLDLIKRRHGLVLAAISGLTRRF